MKTSPAPCGTLPGTPARLRRSSCAGWRRRRLFGNTLSDRALSERAVGKQVTRVSRLAAFFRERPDFWVDGRVLGPIGGNYAWRSRVSDLRRAPFLMTIENRQRSVQTDNGPVVISEYRYVPRTMAQAVSLF